MTFRRDYSCELLALIVLTILSALSHFWLIMIAISVTAAFVLAGSLVVGLFVRAKRQMIDRLLNQMTHTNDRGNVEVSGEIRGVSPSLPVG